MAAVDECNGEGNFKSNVRLYEYKIQPIEGRRWIQQNFVSLPEKAVKYSNRHVTLNERFSIIERGYQLVPILPQCDHSKLKQVRLSRSLPREAVNGSLKQVVDSALYRQL